MTRKRSHNKKNSVKNIEDPSYSTPRQTPESSFLPEKNTTIEENRVETQSAPFDIPNLSVPTLNIAYPSPTSSIVSPPPKKMSSSAPGDRLLTKNILLEEITALSPFIDSSIEDYQYEAFNVQTIREELGRLSIGRNLSEDVSILVACGVYLGPNITTYARRLKGTSFNKITELQRVYAIKRNINRAIDGKRTITMARIVASFPHIAAIMLSKRARSDNVTYDGPLPHFLKFPAAAAIIPKSNEQLFRSFILWSIEFDKRINPKPDETKVESFARISWDSRTFPEDFRLEIQSMCLKESHSS